MRYLFLSLLSTFWIFHQSWGTSGADPAVNPQLRNGAWTAHWICAANTDAHDYSVQHFRKLVELEVIPDSFRIHVSADHRYQLFVNGKRVVWGPARGQLDHWYFETIDLAPFLQVGSNTLAAVVWNFGDEAPMAQETWRTGFILQGDTDKESMVNTDDSWLAMENEAYQPLHFSHGDMRGYFVVGPADRVDGAVYPWGWETDGYDASGWQPAAKLDPGAARGARDPHSRWMLIPRDIPMMEETRQRFAEVRQSEGVEIPSAFPVSLGHSLNIPKHSNVRILLDQRHMTTAYPELIVSGGRGSRIQMRYAEALYMPGGERGDKGDRNVVDGKTFIGYHDLFLPDGGVHRLFRPLWWRTFRYVELHIETGEETLEIEDLSSVFTAYPFKRKATFEAGDPFFDQLMEIGWRTARLCAHETYMDCPYYEQLQYVGDTRIQMLISYYNAGDSRLARKAIAQINASRTAEGLTFSRAPSRLPQYIPGFSLWWIGMLHDYFYYTEDPEWVRSMLSGVESVLSYFESQTQGNGSLKQLPWWSFIDWTSWDSGQAPAGATGSSAPQDLQLLLGYEWAIDMESALGNPTRANHYRERYLQLKKTIMELYWDEKKGLFSDTPEREQFSQHSNALAIVAGLVPGNLADAILQKVLHDKSLTQCSYYFRHYLHEALLKSGNGDEYLEMLGPWKEMLTQNLTTWAERPGFADNPPRSDCHAWSASPNFELFRTVLGIRPASPGFKTVCIEPHLGRLQAASGSIPHPQGTVRVELTRLPGQGVNAIIDLPSMVSGSFVWLGETHPLGNGKNEITISTLE